MPLSAEATALIALWSKAFPEGLHGLPVAQVRARQAELTRMAPRGPEVGEVADFTIPGQAGDIPVRLYQPQTAPDGPAPVLIWAHGGAFALGSLDGADAICRTLVAASGVALLSVDYRLAPEHRFPAGLEDLLSVLRWLPDGGAARGLDAARFAIGGDSAGATLTAAACLQLRDEGGPQAALQLLFYPTTLMRISSYEHVDAPIVPSGMANHFWQLYVRSGADFRNPLCAPMMAEHLRDLPPAFLAIPEVDSTRADQEAYAHRLAADGVLTTLRVYPGTPHGFLAMTGGLAEARDALRDSAGALAAALR
ncbi:alpha/beta hydrolase [Falsigemmobacter intermedius]|uniref:Alpha/beta hydrolase n=1 Tax=Falsigemmobacter intermedius TaxID=1553448 RepID=A0A3S3UWN6_9RHOB|nr:alpha/beta hydrolase [Falsigemmobacter intermedius]RWY37666.1 alpha/beta hydrolase [Falsigemmobacter intermedius]